MAAELFRVFKFIIMKNVLLRQIMYFNPEEETKNKSRHGLQLKKSGFKTLRK